MGAVLLIILWRTQSASVAASSRPGLFVGAFQYATPLTFGALGGLFSERSGVINIGLEGMMLMGCFWGVYAAQESGSWFVGVLGAMFAGASWRSSTRCSRSTCAPIRSSRARP